MPAAKHHVLLAILALSVAAPSVFAQVPGAETPSSPATGGSPDQSAGSASSAAASQNLFPNTPAAGLLAGRPRPNRLLGNKNQRNARATDLISSEADADPLEVRVAFRRAKTQAMVNDPGLADLLRQAAAAPNDKIKRDWLRQYYTHLFAQVRKIDSSPALAAHVALLEVVARQRYDPQRRAVAGEEDLVNGRRGRR